MTGTPIDPIPPILLPPQLEYAIAPAGPGSGGPSNNGLPLIWKDLRYIDMEDEGFPLVGHVVMCRMYQTSIVNEIRTKVYVPYELTQSELSITSPEGPLFINQIDPPEEPTTLFGAELRTYAAGEWAVAGIRDNSIYDYYRVFDQAEVTWLPRASTLEQDYIEDIAYPLEPDVDTSRPRPKYQLDTITTWLPDERESVEVTYTLITNGESVTITHNVYQQLDNFTEKLKRVLNRCYFTHGLYHNSLYLNEADRNYDNSNGKIRGNPVEVYDVDDFLVRTESYNDDNELISVVREPVYPIEGILTPIVDDDEESETYGQLIAVQINNPGAFYPKGSLLKFRNTRWFADGGEAPIARTIVSPIVREEPQEVPITLPNGTIQLQMREGKLTGGEIIEIEIINPGSGMRRIEQIDMKTTSLSNTRYEYNEGFMNTRNLDPIIPIEKRTKDD